MNYFHEKTKTIVALVTAPINQNIAIIRISGNQSYNIIKNIFDKKIPDKKENLSRIILGNIVDENKEIVDQVLLFCFYAPQSFTGEDVIEISCHGNLIIVNKILELFLDNGAEMAMPGEFTKQAFFNQKLNLIQANSINDLIKAPNLSTAKLAIQNFDSKKQKELGSLENILLDVIAKIEINIDYPEYEDIEKITINKLIKICKSLLKEFEKIRKQGKKAEIYKEGIKVGIFGKPNVGKSTLLNSFLNEDKAIVSNTKGTTRDIIESNHFIKGIPLTLFDTAGIRKTFDEVEKKGIEKSKKLHEKVHLSLLILDNSRYWSEEDKEVFEMIKDKKHLVVINKSDLKKRLIVPDFVKKINIVSISAERKEIENLEKKVVHFFSDNLTEKDILYPILSQTWQQSKLKMIEKSLKEVIVSLKKNIPVDIIANELQRSFHLLRELSGNDYDEDLIEMMFSKFCLGK